MVLWKDGFEVATWIGAPSNLYPEAGVAKHTWKDESY